MKLKPWHRRVLLGAATLAVLAAAFDDGKQAEPTLANASTPRTSEPQRSPQPALRVELERLNRPQAKAAAAPAVGNTFSATSWYVPPPPPPPPPPRKPEPPPPPSAPPMPFSYFGRYQDGGTQIILLLRGERIYTVSEGDVIENTYRVGRLTGGQLEMTYLPLDIKQSIFTGAS
jgi:hypothetical protein